MRSSLPAMARVMDLVELRLAEPDSVARIAVQAWGEAVRDPELGEFVAGFLRSIRANFVTLARRAQQAGDLPSHADPEAVGAVLMAVVPGFILQRVHTGAPDADTFVAGLRTLLARIP